MQSFSVAAKFQEWAKNVITIPDIRVLTTSRKILHPFSDVEIEGVHSFFVNLLEGPIYVILYSPSNCTVIFESM